MQELSEQKLRTLFTGVHRLAADGIIQEPLLDMVGRIAGAAPAMSRQQVRAFVYYALLFELSATADHLTVENCATCQHRADAIQAFVARNLDSPEMAAALARVRAGTVVLH